MFSFQFSQLLGFYFSFCYLDDHLKIVIIIDLKIEFFFILRV